MDVYRRYFKITTGPFADAIAEAMKINEKAKEDYQAILEDLGADSGYYQRDGRLVGLIFEGNEPDRYLYKSSRSGWYPKKNNNKAKAIAARIESVKTVNAKEHLPLIGLIDSPTIFKAGRCYWPSLTIIPHAKPTCFVSVPWYDEDPAKIEKYISDRGNGAYLDDNMDSLTWEPTGDMVEVKKWEFDRDIDQWNESLKSAAA